MTVEEGIHDIGYEDVVVEERVKLIPHHALEHPLARGGKSFPAGIRKVIVNRRIDALECGHLYRQKAVGIRRYISAWLLAEAALQDGPRGRPARELHTGVFLIPVFVAQPLIEIVGDTDIH